MRRLVLVLVVALAGCTTVELGEPPTQPFLALDEDTFHCVIQPQVIEQYGCAGSGCHLNGTSMPLEQTAAANCVDGVAVDPIPPGSIANLRAAESRVQGDPASSPFFRAPVGMDSHPEIVFDVNSDPANSVADWILDGTGL